jgi:hypothetical protein
MLRGREDCLATEGCVLETRFLLRVRARREGVGEAPPIGGGKLRNDMNQGEEKPKRPKSERYRMHGMLFFSRLQEQGHMAKWATARNPLSSHDRGKTDSPDVHSILNPL